MLNKKFLCLVKMSKHGMQYYLPFKTWSFAVIKLMWSLCLNPFQEAWWEDKGKEKGSKSNPCCGQRAKAMHNTEAKKEPCQVAPHPTEAENRAGR